MMDIRPAVFVRYVAHGESLDDLIAEARERTWTIEAEHLVLKSESGSRVMVSGGRDGIEFVARDLLGEDVLFVSIEGQDLRVARIYGHTHPRVTGPSDGDLEALRILGQTRSYLIELGGERRGTLIRPRHRRT